MSDSKWQEELRPMVLPLQILVGVMVASSVAVMVLVLTLSMESDNVAGGQLLTYIAIAFAITALLTRTIVPSVMLSHGRRKIANGAWPMTPKSGSSQSLMRLERAGEAGKVWMMLSATTIVAAALIDGATLFLLIAYMIEQSLPAMVLAVAMILTLALHIPTRASAFRWVEDQLVLVRQQRDLG